MTYVQPAIAEWRCPTTQLVPIGESFDLETFVGQNVAAVIKPAVSAAGAGLEFLPDRQAARAFQSEFADRCLRGAQLVQPFLPEIQTNGEWSLVYFGGEYSHGVHKLPASGQIMVHAERGGCCVSPIRLPLFAESETRRPPQ